ncbi:hypothetical protein K488DRAFT_82049 [Vararia minispora EC-137]|uniref:Uncharacterized protein n=1 Tax=Vararia minispora EC-137 TaxID=1314806 RepID=A0ACB8QWZ4_9AGAM|nr:hypothetical protein K488DRAFT_82049 [Vararia minispora EC-137]
MLLLWAVASSHIITLPTFAIALPIALPTLYPWLVDTFALLRGTWIVSPGTKTRLYLWPHIELEEAFVLLVANTIIVFDAPSSRDARHALVGIRAIIGTSSSGPAARPRRRTSISTPSLSRNVRSTQRSCLPSRTSTPSSSSSAFEADLAFSTDDFSIAGTRALLHYAQCVAGDVHDFASDLDLDDLNGDGEEAKARGASARLVARARAMYTDSCPAIECIPAGGVACGGRAVPGTRGRADGGGRGGRGGGGAGAGAGAAAGGGAYGAKRASVDGKVTDEADGFGARAP